MATVRPIAVARFYCSYGDLATHEPSNILGSFVSQLVQRRPQLYKDLRMPSHGSSQIRLQSSTQQPTVGSIQQYLVDCASHFEKIFLFVDAINECSNYQQITTSLANLLSAVPNIRLMVSSTPEVDLGMLQKHPNIAVITTHMPSSSLEPDIRAYVEHQISVLPNLQSLSDRLKRDVLSTLVRRSDGMYDPIFAPTMLLSS
jgi:hypothetical protein